MFQQRFGRHADPAGQHVGDSVGGDNEARAQVGRGADGGDVSAGTGFVALRTASESVPGLGLRWLLCASGVLV